MEGNLPSGLPDQTSRGQAGRGLGEVLEPQPLEQTGPAAMVEAPAEVAAAAESGLPSSEQVAAAGGGARPEQGVPPRACHKHRLLLNRGLPLRTACSPSRCRYRWQPWISIRRCEQVFLFR